MNAAPTAEETRARILTEAERLFRHYGYSKTTVADIAEACGMSSANVYRFFASKSQINEAICDRVIAYLEAELKKIARTDAPASQQLTHFIALVATFTMETYIDQKKVHEMVVVGKEENWASIQRHMEATCAIVAEILAKGMEDGEFKRQDVERTARCVQSAMCSLKHPVIVAQCQDEPNKATVEELTAFILAALKA